MVGFIAGQSNLQPHAWWLGFRFGEALNPGPSGRCFRDLLSVALINPTTVLHKADAIAEVNADVILAAETAATYAVQRVMSPALRSKGYKCHWGPPVPERFHPSTALPGWRGAALGTAVFTSLPSRDTLGALSPEQLGSCRISECLVRMNSIEVRFITLYGFPKCLPFAKERNAQLMAWSYSRACSSRIPCIIGADFNDCPTECPVWQAFAGLGWQELNSLVLHSTGRVLPPTCRDATRHDSFLLSPSVLPFFESAEVLHTSHLFDSHSPVKMFFRMPGLTPAPSIWRLPQTWAGFAPPTVDVEASYAACSVPVRSAWDTPHVGNLGDKLRLWSAVNEDSVHVACAAAHARDPVGFPRSGLPQSHRGRCLPLRRVSGQAPVFPRQARHGEPRPCGEATSVRSRQRLRQCRRLHTFAAALRKSLRGEAPPALWTLSLEQQWKAIIRAPGYGRCFPRWVLQWPCFDFFPTSQPTLEFCSDLLQFLEFDYRALASSEARLKQKLFRFAIQMDAKAKGDSWAFSRIRPPAFPPFNCVLKGFQQPVVELRRDTFACRTYQLDHAVELDLLSEVVFSGWPAIVLRVDHATVVLQFPPDQEHVLPLRGLLQQSRLDATSRAVHEDLCQFWGPIWSRDSAQEATDLECWSGFQDLMRGLSSPCSSCRVDMGCEQAWTHVARGLRTAKATGVSGWSNAELKALPTSSLGDLARILDQDEHVSYPAYLLQAKVALISKVSEPSGPQHARPITVFCNVYRLWGRVLCAQVLSQWALTLPPSVVGYVPGRSATDLAYWCQSKAEAAMLCRQPLSGMAVDLTRAFNMLPRPPLRALLEHLGIPSKYVAFWLTSLQHVTRLFLVHGSLSAPIGCSTGAPEGDPCSVLAMIGLCWLYVTLLQPKVEPAAFADNWVWITPCRFQHSFAIGRLLQLTNCLKLRIDWTKGYFWAVDAPTRRWWKASAQLLLPDGVSVEQVPCVKELGSHLQFTKRRHLGHMVDRFAEATARLHRLFHLPCSLATKAHVIQSGVWPFLFHGAFGVAPGRHRLNVLRGNAARALIGRYHTLSSVATFMLMPGVMDPELFLLFTQLSQLRRSFDVAPQVAATVLQHASAYRQPPLPCGPGSALRVMLDRFEWSLAVDGTCKGPEHAVFCVRTSSPQDIKEALVQAWAVEAVAGCCHRAGLSDMPLPSRQLTTHVVAKFLPWEQQILSRHITGAFMCGQQKVTWSRVDDGLCPLCGAEDTKQHRVFDCPALSEARVGYEGVLSDVQRFYPHWPHLLYASEHPDNSMLRLMAQSRKLPAVPAWTLATRRLSLFTDGAAHHSSCPPARLTYWAIVLSLHTFDSGFVQGWDGLDAKHQAAAFRVLCQGSTPGRQTVARAELSAVAWACRWARQGDALVDLYTDSQYVLDVWQQIQATQSLLTVATNRDLATDLLHAPFLRVFKVKAHNERVAHQSTSSFLKWSTAGNTAADLAARAARGLEMSLLLTISDSVAEHYLHQRDCLQAFGRYLVDLNLLDARYRAAVVAEPQADGQDSSSVLEYSSLLERWRYQGGSLQSQFRPVENLSDFPMGSSFGFSLQAWSRQLRWPTLPVVSTDELGATFLELLIHFVVWTRSLPPVLVYCSKAATYIPHDKATAWLQPNSISACVGSFHSALVSFRKLYGVDLVPGPVQKGQRHLKRLGLDSPQLGVYFRPEFPEARGWTELLQTVCCDGQMRHLEAWLSRPGA